MLECDATLDRLIEHAAMGMQILDANGLTVRVNDAYLALFGYRSRADVEGVHNPLTDPATHAQGLDSYLARAFAGEVVQTPALTFVPSGPTINEPCHLRSTIIPFFDDSGSVANLMIIHEDLASLRASERAGRHRDRLMLGLQAAYRRITESLLTDRVVEAILDASQEILHAEKVAIWTLGDDGEWQVVAQRGLPDSYEEDLRRIRAGSSAMGSITSGFLQTEQPWTYYVAHPNIECPEYDELLAREGIRRVLAVPLHCSNMIAGTLTQYRLDDHEFESTEIEAACLLADHAAAALNNASLFEQVSVMRDELEARVEASTQELRAAHDEAVANEKLTAIGFLAKEVAHGLRNPLNVISASAYYLRTRWASPDEKVVRNFEAISRAVGSAADMITDLTTLAGGSKVEMHRLDITELASRAVLERLVPSGTPVETDWDHNLPPTRGDWAQVLQAMKSILANSSAARREQPVHVATSQDDGFVVFAVGDDRPTVRVEELEATFGPFASSATQWTGLSLSVARQIARRHNGDVLVDSAEGITWFNLRLPIL